MNIIAFSYFKIRVNYKLPPCLLETVTKSACGSERNEMIIFSISIDGIFRVIHTCSNTKFSHQLAFDGTKSFIEKTREQLCS